MTRINQFKAWIRKRYFPRCGCGQEVLLFQIPKIRDEKFHNVQFCGYVN